MRSVASSGGNARLPISPGVLSNRESDVQMSGNETRQERRRFERQAVDFKATVKLKGRADIPCAVANISEGGALLVFDEPQCLPYGFIVTIDGMTGPFGCEMRHHYGVRVGVEFVATARITEGGPEVYGGDVGNWIETEQPLSFG
jgi:hypothetical protein